MNDQPSYGFSKETISRVLIYVGATFWIMLLGHLAGYAREDLVTWGGTTAATLVVGMLGVHRGFGSVDLRAGTLGRVGDKAAGDPS